jgi:hypothetical protein
MSWLSRSGAASVAVSARRAPGKQTWLYFAIALAACSAAPRGNATGPTLPLRFDDAPGANAWSTGVLVDPAQIGSVRVERGIYVDGRQLRAEPITARLESLRANGQVESRMQLPLEFRGMEDLKRMPAFAQKIVVEGQWLQQPSAHPLRVQRWFYFTVENGTITPVDLERYAKITDGAVAASDSRGNAVEVQRGVDIMADVPLPATRGSLDRQVAPPGPVAQRKRSATRDLSETRER